MNITVLAGVIVIQVLAFQFLAVRWSRVLPRYLIGQAGLPEDAAAGVRRWRKRAERARHGLGAVLLLIAVAVGLAGPDAAWSKPVLASLSVVSAAGFVAGFVRDRAVLAALGSRRPAPHVRSATLEPRALGSAYAAAWESVPLVIVGLTLAASVLAATRGGGAHLFWIPAVQLTVAGGGLFLSHWYARSSRPLPQQVRPGLGGPGAALATDRWLRVIELRALLGAKIGIVLLLAVSQAGNVLPALGYPLPPVLEWLEWLVVAALVIVFGSYLFAVARRPATHEPQPEPNARERPEGPADDSERAGARGPLTGHHGGDA